MRIIAGEARGRRLDTLPGTETRPTLERVKEGVFSSVQPLLPGAAVLDLFAGSGQMGLEALSRGAKSCVFIEQNPKAVSLIKENAKGTGLLQRCRVQRAEAKSWLAQCHDKFDLILLDPPFGAGMYPDILKWVAAVAAPGAVVLCESATGVEFPPQAGGLALAKEYRYGTVSVKRYANQGEEGME